MENLTLDEFKTIAEMRDIRRHEACLKRLISSINKSNLRKKRTFK